MADSPAIVNLPNVYHGEDVTYVVTVKQSDGVTAQNITGWALQFAVWRGTTFVLKKTVGFGITITDGTNGVLQVVLAAADTGTTLSGQTYTYMLSRTDSGADKGLMTGTLSVMKPLTSPQT